MNIKETRKILGMTQTQMGKLMGMTQPEIARIESNVRAETKKHIAQLNSLLALHKAGLL